jgi:hypothetical protein
MEYSGYTSNFHIQVGSTVQLRNLFALGGFFVLFADDCDSRRKIGMPYYE